MSDTQATSAPPQTVFVVDDDEQVRISIEQLVKSVGLQVECFASANEFLERYETSRRGCLVTDVRMPGMSGIELQSELENRGIRLPIVVMTGFAEVPMAVSVIKAGAFDFIQKPFSPQSLLDVIQRAIEKDAKDSGRRAKRDDIAKRMGNLSNREGEVMKLLVRGRTTKEIARELTISQTTVDFHRHNVLDKMKVDNVVELTHTIDVYELSED